MFFSITFVAMIMMDQFCQLFQYIFHSTYNPNKISAFLFGHSVKFEFVVKDDSESVKSRILSV